MEISINEVKEDAAGIFEGKFGKGKNFSDLTTRELCEAVRIAQRMMSITYKNMLKHEEKGNVERARMLNVTNQAYCMMLDEAMHEAEKRN